MSSTRSSFYICTSVFIIALFIGRGPVICRARPDRAMRQEAFFRKLFIFFSLHDPTGYILIQSYCYLSCPIVSTIAETDRASIRHAGTHARVSHVCTRPKELVRYLNTRGKSRVRLWA